MAEKEKTPAEIQADKDVQAAKIAADILRRSSSSFGKSSLSNVEPEIPGKDEDALSAEEKAKAIADKKAADEAEAAKNKEPDEEIIETPLFTLKTKKPTDPDNPDEMLKAFNAKTGLEITKWEDMAAKADEIAELKKSKEEVTAASKTAEGYMNYFINAKPEIKKLVIADMKGEDYRALAKDLFDADFDLNKTFREYNDKLPLIMKYNDEIKSETEWDELDDKAKKAIEKSVEKSYNTDRDVYIKEIKDFETTREKQADDFVNSIERSMKQLEKDIPDMKPKDREAIKTKLAKGIKNDLIGDDGVYREDAAVKIAYMVHGKSTLETMMSSVEAKIEKEAAARAKKLQAEELEIQTRGRTDKIDSGGGATRDKNEAEKISERSHSLNTKK